MENQMRKKVRLALSTLLITFLFFSSFCLAQAQAGKDEVPSSAKNGISTPNSPTFSNRNARYILRPDDSFDVLFEFNPEFNQTVTVQPDGFVTMKPVGDLHVSGLTLPQLTNTLEKQYAKIVYRPSITIVLKDFEKPYFVADGQVARPGKYDLRGDTTVTQAIAMAGGFLSSAKHSQVVLFRRASDEWVEAKLIDVKKMENKRNLSEDLHLQPGDMLFVPKNKYSKIESFIPRASTLIPLTQF